MTYNIVIIDDDREMCEEIKDILADEGYAVCAAYDGMQGLALVEKCDCDILLLDLKMPGLDGATVLKRLKEKDTRPRVVVLTARLTESESPEEIIADEEVASLVDRVITKPFRIPELLMAIRQTIDRKESS